MKMTRFFSCRSVSISGETGHVFRKKYRRIRILFLESTSKHSILKFIDLNGLMLKNLKQKSDSFCLADAQSKGETSSSHLWYNLKSSKGLQPFRTVKGSIEPLAFLGKE